MPCGAKCRGDRTRTLWPEEHPPVVPCNARWRIRSGVFSRRWCLVVRAVWTSLDNVLQAAHERIRSRCGSSGGLNTTTCCWCSRTGPPCLNMIGVSSCCHASRLVCTVIATRHCLFHVLEKKRAPDFLPLRIQTIWLYVSEVSRCACPKYPCRRNRHEGIVARPHFLQGGKMIYLSVK